MRIVQLPDTDLRVSVLCLGTTRIGSEVNRDDSFRMLDEFAGQGGTFVDTASVYANWLPGPRHISEKTIGAWLQRTGKRNAMVIATKGAHPELATMQVGRMSRTEIEQDLATSLANLQIDVVDLYWLHRDDRARPVEEIVETLEAQVAAGKIRYYGCSNWRADRIAAAQAYARSRGYRGFVGDQVQWSLAEVAHADLADQTAMVMDESLWEYHAATGLAVLAYSAQANGFFHHVADGTVGRMSQNHQRAYGTPANLARAARANQLATESGLSLTAVVLGYLLAQPFVTVPIVGPRTLAQLRDSLAAADTMLTADQLRFLEEAV